MHTLKTFKNLNKTIMTYSNVS